MGDQKKAFRVVQELDGLFVGFPSCMKNIDEVCRIADHYLKERLPGISDHIFALNLLMREGLTNAVRHGNRNDSKKEVCLSINLSGRTWVHMEIRDQGRGFDWKKLDMHRLPDTEDHGRGIPIMEQYASWYRYNDKGNVLYIGKEI